MLNDCNFKCFARCYRLERILAIGAWYRAYDRTGFGVFFEQCQQDMRMVLGSSNSALLQFGIVKVLKRFTLWLLFAVLGALFRWGLGGSIGGGW